MNPYSVVYLADAEAELIAIWEAASDRTLIAEAANRADRILASLPQSGSVYLSEQLWRLEVVPLRFYFTIREEDRLVEMSNVIRIAE
jgi:hypothetical protein